jgi:2-amino-4-hydroxy-6-hydroxymethyldihydropteridine diphosphokinase
MLSEVFLGLGSNLGDREGNIARAVERLRDISACITVSSLHETRPSGFAAQPAFLNAACHFQTRLDPFELLARLLDIQRLFGAPRTFPNAPRAIDLDILVFGRWVIDSPSLTIPHPRMAQREFVLRPLAEIAPDLKHPVLRESARSLLTRLAPSHAPGVLSPFAGH